MFLFVLFFQKFFLFAFFFSENFLYSFFFFFRKFSLFCFSIYFVFYFSLCLHSHHRLTVTIVAQSSCPQPIVQVA
ncbi:hypothetical protein PRUPE_1G402900 [Prunus persica]|uniref:Uncharacterized protein n=1 Tax=Prunus persica TaxID=3760 RepID=A0A251RAP2_PRUPE|nr:hypothetical protein PRUPE_1G402900 [Prunus persica]